MAIIMVLNKLLTFNLEKVKGFWIATVLKVPCLGAGVLSGLHPDI